MNPEATHRFSVDFVEMVKGVMGSEKREDVMDTNRLLYNTLITKCLYANFFKTHMLYLPYPFEHHDSDALCFLFPLVRGKSNRD